MVILLLCIVAAIAVFTAVAFYEFWAALDRAEKYHAD